jgi:hypothetical protein
MCSKIVLVLIFTNLCYHKLKITSNMIEESRFVILMEAPNHELKENHFSQDWLNFLQKIF